MQCKSCCTELEPECMHERKSKWGRMVEKEMAPPRKDFAQSKTKQKPQRIVEFCLVNMSTTKRRKAGTGM